MALFLTGLQNQLSLFGQLRASELKVVLKRMKALNQTKMIKNHERNLLKRKRSEDQCLKIQMTFMKDFTTQSNHLRLNQNLTKRNY